MKLTIEIDTSQKAAKSFLEFIQNLSFITKVIKDDLPNEDTKKAIQQVRKKKTTKVVRKSKDVFEDILNS